MKKNLALCMAIGTIILNACSSEEPARLSEAPGNVTFTATLPSSIMSRSPYDDGTVATNLEYAVYDSEGTNIATLNGTTTIADQTAKVNLSLVTGKTYTVVFWASAPEQNAYKFDAGTGKMTVTPNGTASDANRDAFFAYENFTVTGAISKDVILRRPFAQINIGTADLDAFLTAGGTISTSGITATAPTVLNLLDGTVEEEKEYVLAPAAFIPETVGFPVESTPAQRWLTTAFILTGDSKTTLDITWTSDNSTPTRDAVKYTYVPVQRNFRTNIYGNLLTDPANYTVIIDEEFEKPDHDLPQVYVTDMKSLGEASRKDKVEIILDKDIHLGGEFTVISNDVIFNGNNHILSGSAGIRFTGKNVTIKNTKFENATGNKKASVYTSGDKVANVIIDNCEFRNFAWEAIQYVPSGSDRQTLTISNCKFFNAEDHIATRTIHIQPITTVTRDDVFVTLKNIVIVNSGGAYTTSGTVGAFYVPLENYTIENVVFTGKITKNDKTEVNPNEMTQDEMYEFLDNNYVFSLAIIHDGVYTYMPAAEFFIPGKVEYKATLD